MNRNIVICADGTGNTFDKRVSNVTRLIRLLAVDEGQIVFYGQGIGTNAERRGDVERYRESLGGAAPLEVLPGPGESRLAPARWAARLAGLVGGYGIEANVREMYRALLRNYRGAEDRVFLFGFSRGAFAVRALAGLIYRCGLPQAAPADVDDCFKKAWRCFRPIREREEEVREFRSAYAPVADFEIEFLGVWDTVKSYGGLFPVMLPHLRHNPIVRSVRHALALHESRSWFNATTWGQLDSDECGAKTRLKEEDRDKYEKQKRQIEEVWFRGCHADVGGSEEETARIALRWMLREAHGAGLRVNDLGESVLKEADDTRLPAVHAVSRWWWLSEILPRVEIDNSGVYPRRRPAWGRTGRRNPDELRRGGVVTFHETAGVRMLGTGSA